MRQIFDEYKRKNNELERTIYDSFDNLMITFNIREPYNNKLDILDIARDKLPNSFYDVFKGLYCRRLKVVIKAIYILRKIHALNSYTERFDVLSKYFSDDKVEYLLDYINPMIKFDLYEQKTINNINTQAIKYYQDWCVGSIVNNLEYANKENNEK